MVRRLFISCRFYIAGSSKGRTSLSESENFGSIPSPAASKELVSCVLRASGHGIYNLV